MERGKKKHYCVWLTLYVAMSIQISIMAGLVTQSREKTDHLSIFHVAEFLGTDVVPSNVISCSYNSDYFSQLQLNPINDTTANLLQDIGLELIPTHQSYTLLNLGSLGTTPKLLLTIRR